MKSDWGCLAEEIVGTGRSEGVRATRMRRTMGGGRDRAREWIDKISACV